jgi:FkbM family methyltransferase
MVHFTFTCCGTRGDVQPCFCIALALLNNCRQSMSITFVTHFAHKDWTSRLLASYSDASASIELVFLQSSDVLTVSSALATGLTQDETMIYSFMRAAASCEDATLTIFNLFALEVAHMAEALGLRCVALSPYPMPHRMPGELIPFLKEEYPQVIDLLQGSTEPGTRSTHMSIQDVEHWAYPLFNVERWKRLRNSLGLGDLFGMSGCAKEGTQVISIPMIPLLYGFPGLVCDHADWPSSVHLASGFWVEEDIRAVVPALLWAEPQRDLVLITFGSMRKLLAARSESCWTADAFAAALMRALHTQAIACAYLVDASTCLAPSLASFPLLQLENAGLPERFEGARVLVGEVSLSSLLVRCKVLVHHGGSGTTAAALTYGTPQIILPFMFDQYAWSDICYTLGVSIPVANDWPEHLTDSAHVNDGQLKETQDAVVRIVAGDCSELQATCQRLAMNMRQHNAVHETALFLACQTSVQEALVAPTSLRVRSVTHAAYEVTFADLSKWVGTNVEEMGFLHREIFENACYAGPSAFNRKLLAHFHKTARKLYVVDVGANVGFASRWVIEHLIPEGRHARIIAIEPASIAAAAFSENLPCFREDPAAVEAAPVVTVTLLQRICSAQAFASHGTAPIIVYPHLLGNSTARPLQMQSHKQALIARGLGHLFDGALIEEVAVTTLSTVIQEYELPVVDFLKIDVEGSELEVLEGILPEYWPFIQYLVVEVHDHKDRLQKVLKLLAASGYLLDNTHVVRASHSMEGAAAIYLVYACR